MTTVAQFQRELNDLIAKVEKSPSNNLTERDMAHDLYIGMILDGAAKRCLKVKDRIKAAFSDKLAAPVEKFDLFVTTDVTVSAKVDNPRQSFDKDAFITMLVTKYNLSGKELHDLANVCTKQTAPVVTITAEVNKNG